MSRLRRPVAVTVGVLVGLIGLLALGVGRARAAARDVPVSPVAASWFVGEGFVHRRGLTTGERPLGELDDVDALARPGFDPDDLHPEVRRFYERTGEYELSYRTTWHVPFRTGARLAAVLTSRIEQLDLPGPGDRAWHRLESTFHRVEEPTPPEAADRDLPARETPRAWIRTDVETGRAVFVALYATHERDGEGLVNIAAPLPGGNVSTVLRPEHAAAPGAVHGTASGIGHGTDGTPEGNGTAIRLTTRADGDPGLYLRTPLGVVRAPASQAFRVWAEPADTDGEVPPPLGAVHEMWLFGRRLLTVDYRIRRAAAEDE